MSGIDGGISTPPIATTRRIDTDGVAPRRHVDGARDAVPPPSREPDAAADIPVLAMPRATDATDLLQQVLAVRLKSGDEQLKSSTEEVRFNGQVQKAKNDEIAHKLDQQIKEMGKSKELGGFMKALQWIGVGLTVAVAVLTLNPVAIAAAVVAVGMAVLNETGTMDKMTNAIAESLQKDGMSENEAKKWAMGLTMAITIVVSIAGMNAGSAAGTTNAAAKMVQFAAKFGEIASKMTIGAKIANALVAGTSAGIAIGKGQHDKNVADKQAEVAEIKAYLAKVKAAMDDETDRIQQMVQNAQDVVSRAFQAMSHVHETNSEIIRHMA